MLQQYHENLDRQQQKQKYDLFEDILDDYEPRYKHDPESKAMRRYVLGRPSELGGSQEEGSAESAATCPEELLRKAVSSLRNCLHLLAKPLPQEDLPAKNKMVESLFNCSILA